MNSRSIFIPINFFIFHKLYWPISQNSVCRQHLLFDATGHIVSTYLPWLVSLVQVKPSLHTDDDLPLQFTQYKLTFVTLYCKMQRKKQNKQLQCISRVELICQKSEIPRSSLFVKSLKYQGLTRNTSKFGIGNSIGKHGLKLCGCLRYFITLAAL